MFPDKRALLAVLLAAAPAMAAGPQKMKTVLYGASYYHEYMPYDRLDKDIALMREAGLTVVRVGESTWSSWEPRDGVFEFAWMDRIIDSLHKAGIQVILGTPTYSIPPWLYRKHPDILLTRMNGQKAAYGPRQNMDITNPAYLYYSERIIREIARHYREHPAVIGYQLDNETSAYGTAGRNVQLAFVDYLKQKFHTTAELNRAWGLAYWGQLINDWDEVPPREGILNPGYKLEWDRFERKLATDFLAWQARIVNEYKRPDQFVTHDFMGGPQTVVDEDKIAQFLDIASVNPYHEVQDALDGASPSLSGDICRSLKHQNYLVTETNAQTTGWDSMGQFPPYDGQLRLNVHGHISSGANMVAYWHWHSLHYGQETYWKGVLSHDLEPNRIYAEFTRTARELQRVGPRLVNFQRKNRVAILYSTDSYHAIQFMPFARDVNYITVLNQMYKALYQLNAGVDFVFPDSTNFQDYDVLVVPPLYSAPDALLERLAAYANAGGHLVLAFKSGFTNEYSTVRWTMAPGPLRKASGFRYQEFSNLKQPIALKGDPFKAGEANRVSVWAEFLIPEGAEALAWYEHPFFGKYPAITRNQYGKGSVTYEGTFLSDRLQERVLAGVLEKAGLAGPDQQLPRPVRVKHGLSNAGRKMHYYLNYSGVPHSFHYPYGAGEDILAGRPVEAGRQIALAPWDVVVIEER